jgi:hypothetical protein
MSTNVDVLIYINELKSVLSKDKEAYDYFLKNIDEDTFFENVATVAENNLLSKGECTLTQNQFEVIRSLLLGEIRIIITDFQEENIDEPTIFIDKRDRFTII